MDNTNVQMYRFLLNPTCMTFSTVFPDEMLKGYVKGELAHHLVKRLYGHTNKRDTTKQIGQHVRWLEHAQKQAEMHSINAIDDAVAMEQDLDIHYQLSNS